MQVRLFTRVVLAAVASAAPLSAACAGGGPGGGPGSVFGPAGGMPGRGGFDAGRAGAFRGLPPVSGVIHERSGGRSYVSPYGRAGLAAGFGRGGYRSYGGYGQAGSGIRYGYGAGRRFGGQGEGRRFPGGRVGFGGGGFGGYGYGGGVYGVSGTYGNAGLYGRPGVYGNAGTYGGQGVYGRDGTYGGYGTTATQSLYGNRYGVPYRSEVPLAVRFSEPPLGPSPYAPYSPDDRYAYAASADVGPGPRILHVRRSWRGDCRCAARSEPVIYPYGIGTAY